MVAVNADVTLQVDGVGKSFGDRRVLTSATLMLRRGRISALLGRNGAGKSTLLKIAAGVVKPDHGLVIFHGRRMLQPTLASLARDGLFYLPERSLLHDRIPLRTHLRAVLGRVSETGSMLDQVLDSLRLRDLCDQPCGALSGGERRRAEVAVVMLREPTCLLADEPFLGLAPLDRDLIALHLRDLARNGTAIVVTGHDAASLLDVADDVTWQVSGTTHYLGTPDEALRHDQFVREYLGPAGAGSPSASRFGG